MKTPFVALVFVMAAACSPAGQDAGKAGAEKQAAPAQQQSQVDPEALQALGRMSAYMRTLQNVEIHARTTMEDVLLETGQKVQFGGEATYRIRRPNAFFLESNTDRRHRQFFYDGTTFTIFSPRMHVYAQRPAPSTIHEMVDRMENQYGMNVPLSDLFYWGTNEDDTRDVQIATHVGFARINGQVTDQYAFRKGQVDAQIWIARGDRPLPLKIIITTLSQPEQPQYTAELTWNTNPRFSAQTFAFRPPSDAHEIRIADNSNS